MKERHELMSRCIYTAGYRLHTSGWRVETRRRDVKHDSRVDECYALFT